MERTKPWNSVARSGLKRCHVLKTPKGMIGERATLYSTSRNSTHVMVPKMMRLITVEEDHGYMEPPKLRPRSNMTVPPTIVRHPSQSNAFSPATSAVLGVSRLKKPQATRNTMAVIGTASGQSMRREIPHATVLTVDVETPPP